MYEYKMLHNYIYKLLHKCVSKKKSIQWVSYKLKNYFNVNIIFLLNFKYLVDDIEKKNELILY